MVPLFVTKQPNTTIFDFFFNEINHCSDKIESAGSIKIVFDKIITQSLSNTYLVTIYMPCYKLNLFVSADIAIIKLLDS
jgi:hypothetical protein